MCILSGLTQYYHGVTRILSRVGQWLAVEYNTCVLSYCDLIAEWLLEVKCSGFESQRKHKHGWTQTIIEPHMERNVPPGFLC